MENKDLNIGEPTPPRYEFRTFGHSFDEQRKLMVKFTQPVPEELQLRDYNDIYIISKNVNDINIKVRNNVLDIKKLVKVENNLERWDAISKYKFPLKKDLLVNEILSKLRTTIPVLDSKIFSIKELLIIINQHKDLFTVPIHKKRQAFLINHTICEYAEVVIGDECIYTISVESIDPVEVVRTVDQLKMNNFENINYIQAIKRERSLINKPFTN